MRILYLVHRIPFPPDKGDKIRSYHWLRALAEHHEVHLVALCDDPADLAHAAELEKHCASVSLHELGGWGPKFRALGALLSGETLSTAWFRHAGVKKAVEARIAEGIDAALVFSSSMAPYALGQDFPVVMDMVDVDSAKFVDYGKRGGGPSSRIHALEGRRLGRYEEELVADCDRVILCTEPECELLRGRIENLEHRGRIRAIRNGAVLPEASELGGAKADSSIVFVGAMDYLANVDAVEFGAREIMPLVRREIPDAVYRIIGRNPAPRVRELDGLPGVEVLGGVDDLAPHLREARVSLVPLRIAQGIQNKILEAMAWQLPVVTNRRLGPTIGAADGQELVLADTAEEYAAATVALLRERERAAAIGAAARVFVGEHFAWSARYRELDRLLDEVTAVPAGEAGR